MKIERMLTPVRSWVESMRKQKAEAQKVKELIERWEDPNAKPPRCFRCQCVPYCWRKFVTYTIPRAVKHVTNARGATAVVVTVRKVTVSCRRCPDLYSLDPGNNSGVVYKSIGQRLYESRK